MTRFREICSTSLNHVSPLISVVGSYNCLSAGFNHSIFRCCLLINIHKIISHLAFLHPAVLWRFSVPNFFFYGHFFCCWNTNRNNKCFHRKLSTVTKGFLKPQFTTVLTITRASPLDRTIWDPVYTSFAIVAKSWICFCFLFFSFETKLQILYPNNDVYGYYP